jgi:hypothetical protein
LTRLFLDNNFIEKISGLDSLVHLVWLDLSFNRIKRIEGRDLISNSDENLILKTILPFRSTISNQPQKYVWPQKVVTPEVTVGVSLLGQVRSGQIRSGQVRSGQVRSDERDMLRSIRSSPIQQKVFNLRLDNTFFNFIKKYIFF